MSTPKAKIIQHPGSGGHNVTFKRDASVEVDAVLVRDWLWVKKPDAERWTNRKIYMYLARWLKRHGMVYDPNARDVVSRLADAHHMRMMAKIAITNDPVEPQVGKRCAYVVVQSTGKEITDCLKIMGIYPLAKVAPPKPDPVKPDEDSDDAKLKRMQPFS